MVSPALISPPGAEAFPRLSSADMRPAERRRARSACSEFGSGEEGPPGAQDSPSFCDDCFDLSLIFGGVPNWAMQYTYVCTHCQTFGGGGTGSSRTKRQKGSPRAILALLARWLCWQLAVSWLGLTDWIFRSFDMRAPPSFFAAGAPIIK